MTQIQSISIRSTKMTENYLRLHNNFLTGIANNFEKRPQILELILMILFHN